MKKHISLFLALLLVVSTLFVTTTSAAEQSNNEGELTLDTISACVFLKGTKVPRATDSVISMDSAILSAGSGDETTSCSHNYSKPVPYSDTQHKKTCTKCKKTVYSNHSFTVEATNNSIHTKTCTICGKSIPKQHVFSDYVFLNQNKHQKQCSVCNLKVTKSHTIVRESMNESKHKEYCTVCKFIFSTSSHNFKYLQVWKDFDYQDCHIKRCPMCNYWKVQLHAFTRVDPTHIECKYCHYRCYNTVYAMSDICK